MPLDALGRTRATMPGATGFFPIPTGTGNRLKALALSNLVFEWRAWAWGLQFFPTNEECLVAAGH